MKTFNEILEAANVSGVSDTERQLFVSNRYYFLKLGADSVEVAGVVFEKPESVKEIRNWYRKVIEKISGMSKAHRDLFVSASLEPWLFFRWGNLPEHEINILVDELKRANKATR